jgi:hypothetical protein
MCFLVFLATRAPDKNNKNIGLDFKTIGKLPKPVNAFALHQY